MFGSRVYFVILTHSYFSDALQANVGDPWSELRSHLPSHGRYTTTCTIHELPAWDSDSASFHYITSDPFPAQLLLICERGPVISISDTHDKNV